MLLKGGKEKGEGGGGKKEDNSGVIVKCRGEHNVPLPEADS